MFLLLFLTVTPASNVTLAGQICAGSGSGLLTIAANTSNLVGVVVLFVVMALLLTGVAYWRGVEFDVASTVGVIIISGIGVVALIIVISIAGGIVGGAAAIC